MSLVGDGVTYSWGRHRRKDVDNMDNSSSSMKTWNKSLFRDVVVRILTHHGTPHVPLARILTHAGMWILLSNASCHVPTKLSTWSERCSGMFRSNIILTRALPVPVCVTSHKIMRLECEAELELRDPAPLDELPDTPQFPHGTDRT